MVTYSSVNKADKNIINLVKTNMGSEPALIIENEINTEDANKRKAAKNKQKNKNVEEDEIAIPPIKIQSMFIPTIDILLNIQQFEGFPADIDQNKLCTHLKESNIHYRVKAPEFEPKENQFVIDMKNMMYQRMKDECFTKLVCDETTCNDGYFSEDDPGFQLSGIKKVSRNNQLVVEPVTDGDLLAIMFCNKTMIHHGLSLIQKDGSVYQPLIDRRAVHKMFHSIEDILCLKSQTVNGKRNYLCRVCGCKSISFKSPKAEALRIHVNIVHGRAETHSTSAIDSLLSVIGSFAFEVENFFDDEIDRPSTAAVLSRFDLTPKQFTKANVKEALLELASEEKKMIKSFASDPGFEIPQLNTSDSDYYTKIIEETAKCHTFYSITLDFFKQKKNKHYVSVFLHLTGLHSANPLTFQVERDHVSHLLSLQPVEDSTAKALYYHTKSVLQERVGNISPLAAITTLNTSRLDKLRNMFMQNQKTFSLNCVADTLQEFYADVFNTFTEVTDKRSVDNMDRFHKAVIKYGMTEYEYEILLITFTRDEMTEITTAEQLAELLKKERPSIYMKMFVDKGPLESMPEKRNRDAYSDLSESSTDDDVAEVEDPDNINSNEEDDDEFVCDDYKPKKAFDFNVTMSHDMLKPLDSDEYPISVLHRSDENPELEEIIKDLDDCKYDTEHKNFVNAQKYLKSVGYGLDDIRYLHSKLRTITSFRNKPTADQLGLSGLPPRYSETNWMSMKEFYTPFINQTCRPVTFKKFCQMFRLGSTAFWLTYEDFIFIRIMMGYLNELEHLINVASHETFNPLTTKVVLEMGYECSLTMIYNFEKLGFISEENKNSMIKRNTKMFIKNTRGSLQDLMFLLSSDVAGKRKYIVDTCILTHNIITYKFTDELYMDVDNYLSPKSHTVDNYSESSKKYSSVRSKRLAGGLEFEPTISNNVFKALKTDIPLSYLYHSLYESKYSTITKNKKIAKLEDMQTGSFCYKNMGYDPSDQLLNLILEDVSQFASVAVGVEISQRTFMKNYQKKYKKEDDDTYNRIYLHLRKIDVMNSLVVTHYLRHGYQSPFNWVLNLIMSISATTTVNSKRTGNMNDVNSPYRYDNSDELREAIAQLDINTKESKETKHFKGLTKGMTIKKYRDVLYHYGGVKSSVNDYNLVVHEVIDSESDEHESEPDYEMEISSTSDDGSFC